MAKQKNQRPAPPDTVFQLMAEVISLREQVAQAELAAHMGGPSLVPTDKLARSMPRGPEKIEALKKTGLLRKAADDARGISFAKRGRPRK